MGGSKDGRGQVADVCEFASPVIHFGYTDLVMVGRFILLRANAPIYETRRKTYEANLDEKMEVKKKYRHCIEAILKSNDSNQHRNINYSQAWGWHEIIQGKFHTRGTL